MNPNIIVQIPEKCFISPDPKRIFPCEFFFTVKYGYIPKSIRIADQESGLMEAIKAPQITIHGFEQLLQPDRIDSFIDNLYKSGNDWSIKKSTVNSSIVLKYLGDDLEPDFSFTASTNNFLCGSSINQTATLRVEVKNFKDVEDQTYIISTKVCYAPWAKWISFDKNPVELGFKVEVSYAYDGDGVDKKLFQNGVAVDTARSPYTAKVDRPTVFTLEVFNQESMRDITQADIDVEPPQIESFSSSQDYYYEGESIELTWKLKSASSLFIEHLGEMDKVEINRATVYPPVKPDMDSVTYTLRAYGYQNKDPHSVSSSLMVKRSYWRRGGLATGYFSGDIYQNNSSNSRLFLYQGNLFCYAHPALYQSKDGLNWEECSRNNSCDQTFCCLAAAIHGDELYAMGKLEQEGKALYFTQYNFLTSKWSYAPAHQRYASDKCCFTFSSLEKWYMQAQDKGMLITRGDADGFWNRGSKIIIIDNQGKDLKLISGDYCFYKDRFYAAMLCSDHRIYVYDCSHSMQDVLFTKQVKEDDSFIRLISSTNRLYLYSGSILMDVRKQEQLEGFNPTLKRGERPWLGVNREQVLTGIFPDKHIWFFEK